MIGEEMNKISLKEVFINTKRVYKEERKVLLKISGIQMLLAYAMLLSSAIFVFIPEDQIIVTAFAALLRLLLVLFATYFSVRMFASLILASRSGYYGNAGTISDFYREVGPVTWRCIGYRFLLALIYTIPILIIVVAYVLPATGYDIPLYVRGIVFVAGGIPLLILLTLFYYAIPTAVTYRHPKSILGYSARLLKGNVLNVFALVLVSGLVGLFPLAYTSLLNVANYGFLGQAGLYLIEVIILWLITPFTTSLSVVSMQMIEAKNRENIEKENYAS
jgi:hypothetical protein